MRPAKTQISLSICPVWSESSLGAQWVAKDPSFLHADSEDSDQTGRMPRLIRVFAVRTVNLLVYHEVAHIVLTIFVWYMSESGNYLDLWGELYVKMKSMFSGSS